MSNILPSATNSTIGISKIDLFLELCLQGQFWMFRRNAFTIISKIKLVYCQEKIKKFLFSLKVANDLMPIFVDVEGTKEVKRMINLLAITVNLYHEIDADPSGSGSKTDRVRK